MLRLRLKNLFSSKLTNSFYIAALLLITLIGFGFMPKTSADNIIVGIVDLEKNAASEKYIAALEHNQLITPKILTTEQVSTSLINGQVACVLTIPQGQFEKQNSKIKLEYLKTNAYISALVDVLALPLLPDIMAEHINKASERYKQKAELKQNYFDLIERLKNNITIDVNVELNQLGTQSEQAIIIRENAENRLLLALFISIILIIYPSIACNKDESLVEQRLQLSTLSRWQKLLFHYGALLIYDSSSSILISLSIFASLQLKPLVLFLLFIFCQVLLTFWRLIISTCFQFLEQTAASFISMALIISTAIIGGSFFDAALLGEKAQKIGMIMPFGSAKYALDELFYFGTFSTKVIYILISYILISLILIYIDNKTTKRSVA